MARRTVPDINVESIKEKLREMIRQQRRRYDRLVKLELPARGRPASYNPHLRYEMGTLATLMRTLYVMEKIGDPTPEGEGARAALGEDFRGEQATAEKVLRTLLNAGTATLRKDTADGSKPAGG